MSAKEAVTLDRKASPPDSPSPDADKVVISTRFGDMEFDRSQAIHMPRGLLGFPGKDCFALANLPQPNMEKFSLLQCLDDPQLSFLIVPFDMGSDIIEPADIERGREDLGIRTEDLAVVLIVTIREIANKPQISVNLRAPIFFDALNRKGVQYILANSKYPIQHVIPTEQVGGEPA